MTQRRYTLTYTLAITSVVGPTVLSWCFTPGLITGPSMPAIGKKKGAPLAEPYPQTKPTINLQCWRVYTAHGLPPKWGYTSKDCLR